MNERIMPELPEVEVLRRHLAPLLRGRKIRSVEVRRDKVLRPTSGQELVEQLEGSAFRELSRRGKYLVFRLHRARTGANFQLLGHLGMTGRMYLLPSAAPLPKHAAVVLHLGREKFVFEDTRYFGRLTFDCRPLTQLGPEPLDWPEPPESFIRRLKRSGRPIKMCLLDQSFVAGVGNIYASEALFRARISPRTASCRLTRDQVTSLWRAIKEVLSAAIAGGSTVPLNFGPDRDQDQLFYFGKAPGSEDFYAEGLHVYDRARRPCGDCGTPIRRIVQGGRSTFFCPGCQSHRKRRRVPRNGKISD